MTIDQPEPTTDEPETEPESDEPEADDETDSVDEPSDSHTGFGGNA